MILIMKTLLHNEYKIINLWYPTYVYQFLIFLIITKIECWPVFKQDPFSTLIKTLAMCCSFTFCLPSAQNIIVFGYNSRLVCVIPPVIFPNAMGNGEFSAFFFFFWVIKWWCKIEEHLVAIVVPPPRMLL